VKGILIAAGAALIVSILCTPYLIKVFSRHGFGQEIRQEGPTGHQSKRGTPTMGGVAILVALWAGYLVAHGANVLSSSHGYGITVSGLLVLGLATVLGVVGFVDDFLKIRKQRNLGLNKTAKSVGLVVAAVLFGILAMRYRDRNGLTPASPNLSFARDISIISLGFVGFVIFAVVVVSAWANAVNFTDGLDGLAGGCSAMVLATYVVITFFQNGHDCTAQFRAGCFFVRDPLDIALVAAAALGACAGFLWWNAAPAKIFMGDTGSLALGGALAGLAIVTRTDLLLLVLGGLFVIITMSVVIQVGSFKLRRKRVFKMAPLQHHFELVGWAETTIVVRFWLIAGMFVALGLGVFYVGWFPK